MERRDRNSALDRIRFPLLGFAALSLSAAVWGGLVRMGWGLPTLQTNWVAFHAPLMISGFLGTLIAVERAVALTGLQLKRGAYGWTYLGPLLTGVGALIVALRLSMDMGSIMMSLGSLMLVIVFIVIVRLQPALYSYTMALGAVLWLGGNIVWLAGRPVSEATYWWAGFLIVTIAGERLELGRILSLSRARETAFLISIGAFVVGLFLILANYALGVRLVGGSLVALAGWLLRHDVARRTVKSEGLPKFSAVSMRSGYIWLIVGGLLALWLGDSQGGFHYDAILHSIFLGFVFSMIFGHAPIIIPAVLGRAISYHKSVYTHLFLLHASLSLRLVGDLAGWGTLRQWGGMLNAVTLLIFLVNTVLLVRASPAHEGRGLPAVE